MLTPAWALFLPVLFLKCARGDADSFTEELFIKPLSNNHVYTYFQFTTTWSTDVLQHHSHLFPRSFGEIISLYQIEELHLSLTEGLWKHLHWGYPIVDAPSGAEMYAWFSPDSKDVDSQWKLLTESMSGLFCASLNFIDLSNSLRPQLSFRPSGVYKNFQSNSSFVRYATLPREIVCTENLTPWKKLLPCDSKKGLAMLLNSGRLHNTNYHSLGIHFRSVCGDDKCTTKSYELKQTMSLVYDAEIIGSRDWSVQKLFGQGIMGPCPLAVTSLIYVDTSSNDSTPFTLVPNYDRLDTSVRGGVQVDLAIFDLNQRKTQVFNIAAIHSQPQRVRVPIPPPLYVNRYIAGYGQEISAIVTQMYNNHWQPIDVIVLENIPWFLPVYLQSLSIENNVQKIVPKAKYYIPGKGKSRPYYLELALRLPPKSTTTVSIDFDYVFMKWQEYPPDANHGFYIGSAVVTAMLPVARNFTSSISYFDTLNSSIKAPRPGYIVQMHTENMIITLPTPDFSMPYNVICLACTVVALAFGPLHNITTKSLYLRLDTNDGDKSMFQIIKEKLFCKKLKKTEPEVTDQVLRVEGDSPKIVK